RDLLSPLLPGVPGDHEQHPVESQRVTAVGRDDDGPDVDGGERAAEHPHSLGHGTGFYGAAEAGMMTKPARPRTAVSSGDARRASNPRRRPGLASRPTGRSG